MSTLALPASSRSLEIWQTRLQRELIALQESPPLPPFVHVGDVTILLEHGVCNVQFRIDLEGGGAAAGGEGDGAEGGAEGGRHVTVMIDASVRSDEESGEGSTQYPFLHPVALLLSDPQGALPEGSAGAGDRLPLDCDWTPSLHISDAAVSVGLRVREAVRKGAPLAAVTRQKTAGPAPSPRAAPVEITIGSVISMEEARTAMYGCRCVQRPDGVAAMIAEAEARRKRSSPNTPTAGAPIWDSLPSGEEDGGPDGTSDYMKLRAGSVRKVARDGLFGASNLFRGLVKKMDENVRQVMEESFVVVHDGKFMEVRANKFNLGQATVTVVLPIQSLVKLKFRRNESLSLYFNHDPNQPMIYICQESALVVKDIQQAMKRFGVEGKHTHTSMIRSMNAGENIMRVIVLKERELEAYPTVENVDEIMDLYRQAAEKFGSCEEGNARKEKCMEQLRAFLERPHVVAILEGEEAAAAADRGARVRSFSPSTVNNTHSMDIPLPHGIPAGEVIEPPNSNAGVKNNSGPGASHDGDDDDGLAEEEEVIRGIGEVGLEAHIGSPMRHGSPSKKKGPIRGKYSDDLQATDDIVAEAERDMQRSLMLSMDADDEEDADDEDFVGSMSGLGVDDGMDPSQGNMGMQLDDTRDSLAELDAMLSDAEGKLASVLGSSLGDGGS